MRTQPSAIFPGTSGSILRSSSLPLVVGLVFLALFGAAPSFLFNFDGVACAIAVELRDLRHLVHGNHLFYGLAGLGFHRVLQAVGIHLSALLALQLMGSALGACGTGLFCALLRRKGFSDRLSVLAALGLGLSYIWWLRSIDAQVYILGTFFLLFALGEALRDRPRPYRLALWHALAMLSHASHALFAPAAVFSLWAAAKAPEEFREGLGRYLIAAAGLVSTSYLAAVVLFLQPADAGALKVWLLGSAALGPDRAPMWIGFSTPLQALRDWLDAALRMVSPVRWLAIPVWGAALWSLTGLRNGSADTSHRRLVLTGALWLAAYPVLFLFWEPYKLDYHLADTIPLWLLAAAAIKGWPRRPARLAGVAAFILVMGAVNFGIGIRRFTSPDSNVTLQKALWLAKAVPEQGWIAALGSDEVYIPYFAHRRTLNLRYFRGQATGLHARVRELVQGSGPVFVTSDLLDAEWQAAFSALHLDPVAEHGALTLYHVTP